MSGTAWRSSNYRVLLIWLQKQLFMGRKAYVGEPLFTKVPGRRTGRSTFRAAGRWAGRARALGESRGSTQKGGTEEDLSVHGEAGSGFGKFLMFRCRGRVEKQVTCANERVNCAGIKVIFWLSSRAAYILKGMWI